MVNKIKMKLIYLWYDYLQYKLSNLCKKPYKYHKLHKIYNRLQKKIDHLEVKYMHKEVYPLDWDKIEKESNNIEYENS